jgi:hypothetical protein
MLGPEDLVLFTLSVQAADTRRELKHEVQALEGLTGDALEERVDCLMDAGEYFRHT